VANDALKIVEATTAAATISDGVFQAIAVGSNTNATGEILEITGTNVVDLTATADGGTLETLIQAAIGNIATGKYTVVIYSGANAGIYSMIVGTANIANASEFEIELIANVVGVGRDNLDTFNFYGG
jgi:hypothetical protein